MGRGQKKVPTIPEHCESIKAYEATPYWRAKSAELLDNKYCVCAVCGRSRWKWLTRKQQWKRVLRFSTHHVRYNNVPHEKPEDLITVCSLCHTTCHDLLRYANISTLFKRLADIVREYFKYEGNDGFTPW